MLSVGSPIPRINPQGGSLASIQARKPLESGRRDAQRGGKAPCKYQHARYPWRDVANRSDRQTSETLLEMLPISEHEEASDT